MRSALRFGHRAFPQPVRREGDRSGARARREAKHKLLAGKFPDIGTVVNITHRMREEINKILVSFVESSSVKDEEVF